MNKAEREHMNKVAQLGCVVCRNERLGETPACCHHIREGQGMSQRASNYEVIPLCPTHHQYGGGGHIAFHKAPYEWQKRYGTEEELLEQVYSEIGFNRVKE